MERGMTDKPRVLVTRRFPEAVEARLRCDYDAHLNTDDRLYSNDELVEKSVGAVAIFGCPTERFSSELIARLPDSVKALVNFSVGYDHVDIAAARKRGQSPKRS